MMRQLKRPRYQSEGANRSLTPEFGTVVGTNDDSSILRKLSSMLRPAALKYVEEQDSNKENQAICNHAQDHEDFDSSLGKPRFALLPNLADGHLGSRIVFVSDEYYGAASNILDGMSNLKWETRRRRTSGHDWVLIQLACPGMIKGIEVNVTENDRNMAPSVSIEAGYFKNLEADIIQHCVSSHPTICSIADSSSDAICEPFGINGGARLKIKSTLQSPDVLPEDLIESVSKILDKYSWDEILPLTRLRSRASGSNFFSVIPLLEEERKVTHLRLNIFPDGSIAKLKVFGEVRVSPGILRLAQNDSPSKSLEVATVTKGGWVLHCSSSRDMAWRLLLPHKSLAAEDAWITPRQILRPPILIPNSTIVEGVEFVVIKLATRCAIECIELHTHHLWGEYPAYCNIDVIDEQGLAELPWVKQMLTFNRQFEEIGTIQANNTASTPPIWIQLDGDVPMKPHDENRVYFEHQADKQASKAKSGRAGIILPSSVSGVTHIRVRLRPDGALTRIRVFGKCASTAVDTESAMEAHNNNNTFLPPVGAGQGRRFSIRRRQH